MDIQCPSCQRRLSIGDQYAGQLVKCPACNGVFSAPSLAPPVPAAAPPPPQQAPLGFAGDPVKPPPTFSSSPPPPPPSAPPAIFEEEPALPPGNFNKTYRAELCPETLRWVGPVAVSLLLVLSFFPWIIDYGRVTVATPPVPKVELKEVDPDNPGPAPTGAVASVGPMSLNLWDISFGSSGTGLWICYLLFTLFLAMPLAWVKLLIEMNFIPKLDFLRPYWSWRAVAVGGFLTFTFLFALLGWFTYTGTQVSASGLYLGFLAHLVAIVAFALEYWLTVRKTQNLPLPEVTVRW